MHSSAIFVTKSSRKTYIFLPENGNSEIEKAIDRLTSVESIDPSSENPNFPWVAGSL